MAVLLLSCVRALALNPALDISQYSHYGWKNSDGFAKGYIAAIAQTPDGYLWLRTTFGLLRFDGVRAVLWTPPSGERLPSDYVEGLLVSRDGTLWIGTRAVLASWKGGKLTHLPGMQDAPGRWAVNWQSGASSTRARRSS